MKKRKPAILGVVSKIVGIAGWVVLGIALFLFLTAENLKVVPSYTFSALTPQIVQKFVAGLLVLGALLLWGVAAVMRFFDNRRA